MACLSCSGSSHLTIAFDPPALGSEAERIEVSVIPGGCPSNLDEAPTGVSHRVEVNPDDDAPTVGRPGSGTFGVHGRAFGPSSACPLVASGCIEVADAESFRLVLRAPTTPCECSGPSCPDADSGGIDSGLPDAPMTPDMGIEPADACPGGECTSDFREPTMETFTVPAGCSSYLVKVWGAGGGGVSGNGNPPGAGGFATGVVAVSEGETLLVVVGSAGGNGVGGGAMNPSGAGSGGVPGGGAGGRGGSNHGGGGGGFSGLFRGASISASEALLIAGAGGGLGGGFVSAGAGAGGGQTGQAGSAGLSGGPGTQTAGGAGASRGENGAQFQGGQGGEHIDFRGGGGGGGGWYGAGGASANMNDGFSASGGSGYVHPSEVTGGSLETGDRSAPAAAADADRMSAGEPRGPGAVVLRCQP